MDKTIITRENENSSIEKLGAQKEIYSSAKNYFYLQACISVVTLVVLSFAQLMFTKYDFSLVIATVSIIVVVVDKYLEIFIGRIKERAAKIGELFDTYVLNICWNNILCGNKPEYNEISQFYSKFEKKNDTLPLHNWYETEITRVPHETGILICQKTNCTYDSSIRKKFNLVFKGIAFVAISLIILFTIFLDFPLSKIVLTVVFPMAPIIQWMENNIIANNESIKNLERLNNLLNATWETLKNGASVNDTTIRQIQDGIFINRKSSPLIPDYVYKKFRDKHEKQTKYSVKELVAEINGIDVA